MKRTFVKIVNGKFLPILVIATTLIGAAPLTGMAKNNHSVAIFSTESTASVKYTGSTDNALLFDVKINNPKGDKFTLLIKDVNGDILFSKEFSDTSFSKKIKLLKSDDNSSYNFTVKSANKGLANSFAISTETRQVEDVTVTKL